MINGIDFSDLLTEQPESCSGQSSVPSRRQTDACTRWSFSSSAPASTSQRYLEAWWINKNQRIGTAKIECGEMKLENWHFVHHTCVLLLHILQGGPVCIKCPSGGFSRLTPAELAHRVSRFGQTAEQHLLPVGVGWLSQLVLWQEKQNTNK